MKVGFLFGNYSVGHNPLDFYNLWKSSRGLSGSDLSVIRVMMEWVKLGYDVSFFSCYTGPQPKVWEGIKLYNFEDRYKIIQKDWDAIISWSEFDALRGCPVGPIRVCCDQLNTFSYCAPNWNETADIITSPSQGHLDYHRPEIPDISKWHILALGADQHVYKIDKKIPGKMVFFSSPDRGLHNLLSVYPKIKKAAPEAHLKVFYGFNYEGVEQFEKGDLYYGRPVNNDILETANRIRYMREMLKRLQPLGVEHIGSVSRERINQELSEATVMAYPCDTLSWSEGFSVSIMEACMAEACPIISDVDGLASVYTGAVPMVKSPIGQRLPEFTDLVIRGLTDEKWREETNKKCKEFALCHTWKHTAKRLEEIIKSHPKFNRSDESYTVPELSQMPALITPYQESTNTDQLVKLNIASGPNVFAGWKNYDREDINSYLAYLKSVPTTDGMPEEQKKLTSYIKGGGEIDFKVRDLKDGFPEYKDDSIFAIYLGQCIEHWNRVYESVKFLKECYRLLSKNGILRITTPDMDLLIDHYKENKMDKFINDQPDFYKNFDQSGKLAMLMFGSVGPRTTWNFCEGHLFLYTKKSMTMLLEEVGFRDIIFYDEPGKSKNQIIAKEVIDQGASHSLIVECVK